MLLGVILARSFCIKHSHPLRLKYDTAGATKDRNFSRLPSTRYSNVGSYVNANVRKLSRHLPNCGGLLLHGIVGSMGFLIAESNFDLVGFQRVVESQLGGSARLEASAETLADTLHLLIGFPTEE